MALATAKALVAAEMRRPRRATASRASRSTRSTCAKAASTARRSRRSSRAKARPVSSTRGGGLAFPAAALAAKEAIKRAKRYGVAFAGVTNSHHFGAAAYHLAPVAQAGLVGLAFTQLAGGDQRLGRQEGVLRHQSRSRRSFRGATPQPLVVDLSLTEVVRGKIMLYAKEGKPIPLGWARRQGRQPDDRREGRADRQPRRRSAA